MRHTSGILRLGIILLVFCIWHGFDSMAVSQAMTADPPRSPLGEQVLARLNAVMKATTTSVHGEKLQTRDLLLRFYARRAFQPIWVSEEGMLWPGELLVHTIRMAGREGLRASAYHLQVIETLMTAWEKHERRESYRSQPDWVALELLLSDAYFTYGAHATMGQIDPQIIREVWVASRPGVDLVALLEHALEAGTLAELLSQLRPPYQGYAALLHALVHYRDLAAGGGWPTVPDGPKLQKGDRDVRVVVLRQRLAITQDLESSAGDESDDFDAAVEQALIKFQRRHGLEQDGVVRTATLAALNVSVQSRVRQLELNMERWRWLPDQLGSRYILVNITNFTLDVVEQGQSTLSMRVIVGKPSRRTPFFSGDVSYLVLNPHWYVPPTIAVQDKLPLIRRDPGYLARQKFKIFRDGERGAVGIDPKTINWAALNARNFSYRLRQDPGPRNALGRIKFMFPNAYHVYLHDTPARELFAKTERAFSSGCIRLEKPVELAEYLLRDDPQWSRQRILATIEKGAEQVVHIPTAVPVYLLYWTAWASEDGVVHFRSDIYERDKVLERALHEMVSPRGGEERRQLATEGDSDRF